MTVRHGAIAAVNRAELAKILLRTLCLTVLPFGLWLAPPAPILREQQL